VGFDHDPNGQVALDIREKYPTPRAIATATLAALRGIRVGHHPSEEKLVELQRLASQSIGIKNTNRLWGLIFEQRQLIIRNASSI
jgi:hypothetical protein